MVMLYSRMIRQQSVPSDTATARSFVDHATGTDAGEESGREFDAHESLPQPDRKSLDLFTPVAASTLPGVQLDFLDDIGHAPVPILQVTPPAQLYADVLPMVGKLDVNAHDSEGENVIHKSGSIDEFSTHQNSNDEDDGGEEAHGGDLFARTFQRGNSNGFRGTRMNAQDQETPKSSGSTPDDVNSEVAWDAAHHASEDASGKSAHHPRSPTPLPVSSSANVNPVGPKSPSPPPKGASASFRVPVASPMVSHRALQERILSLIPRLPSKRVAGFTWPEKRYWVAVIPHPATSKTGARLRIKTIHEKDPIWMKANRLTTIRTIWTFYQTHTMSDPHTMYLLCGGWEAVGPHVDARGGDSSATMELQLQQMDYFSDKVVVFVAKDDTRPVVAARKSCMYMSRKKHQEAMAKALATADMQPPLGRDLWEGLIPKEQGFVDLT